MKPQVYYEHMYKKQRKLVQKDRQDRRVKKERERNGEYFCSFFMFVIDA